MDDSGRIGCAGWKPLPIRWKSLPIHCDDFPAVTLLLMGLNRANFRSNGWEVIAMNGKSPPTDGKSPPTDGKSPPTDGKCRSRRVAPARRSRRYRWNRRYECAVSVVTGCITSTFRTITCSPSVVRALASRARTGGAAGPARGCLSDGRRLAGRAARFSPGARGRFRGRPAPARFCDQACRPGLPCAARCRCGSSSRRSCAAG